MTRERAASKVRSESKVQTSVEVEVGKVAFTALSVSSGIIGAWAGACLVSAMVSSGGPVSLAMQYFSAVVG